MDGKSRIHYKDNFITVGETEQGYVYIEEKPGVCILPISEVDGKIKVLLRREYHPFRGFVTTIITGRKEQSETFIDTVRRELKEESGYVVSDSDIMFVSDIYYGKSSITADQMYIVLVRDMRSYGMTTDGSIEEKFSTNEWYDVEELVSIVRRSNDGPLMCAVAKFFAFVGEVSFADL